ncbi:sodium:dicarboxylate symporter [Gemmatirosa kalamazoonensis]|uniref:Sodium:dicarboxylate symporter n=1 Tax=Gemmatirosa kalamazoonensis TaxID=861299 RepID=W0R9Z0_9BACT|nr:dicarboxylate/amino acid:cation symporter [Gemmatirosa kalamazoonensis]AHG87929.1 sodium:dicarboxylate symporter [Gemmatirosa kalamazoonensis]
MSLTTRVLVALVLGLALGVLVSAVGSPALVRAAGAIEPLGTLWINAIRMVVIPLVVASLVVGVASSSDTRSVGRIGGRALVVFVVALLVGGVYAVLVATPLLRLVPLSPAATSALRASAASTAAVAREGATKIPTAAQWLVDLVPPNPVKAAADGAMLPLIVFTLLFALAASRLTAERRAPLVGFFHAVADASLVLVRWVLAVAPIGVFALALPLAARLGAAAAGAVASYVVITAAATTLFMLLVLYPAAVVLGRVPLGRFARAALPAQAVAFSSRSSLAALPAMIETARTRLALPEAVTTFLLPLAAATFRVGGAVGQTIGALFLARLYGVTLDVEAMLAIVATVVVMTFSIPGVPAGSVIAIVPVLLAAGIPVEGLGILIGVDTIPDMFRTTTNVTGDLVAATIVGGRGGATPRTSFRGTEEGLKED